MDTGTRPERQKVYALVTRSQNGRRQVLVFEHRDQPDAGLQVPGGTVDPGETLEEAVLREVWEESGLTAFRTFCYAGKTRYWNEEKRRYEQHHVYILEVGNDDPDVWNHVVASGADDAGLVFVYRWASLTDASASLLRHQGEWIRFLKEP